MKINSYGWVILIVICVLFFTWVGGRVGYSVDGVPAEQGTIEFITNLALGKIDGMPIFFTIFFDIIPFFVGWIVYRQLRGQD